MNDNIALLKNILGSLKEEKKYNSIRDILATLNPADIAEIFSQVPQQHLLLLFRLLPKEAAAETFVEMDPDLQEILIRGFSDNELKDVLNDLYADDAVDLIEEMPSNVVTRILRQADPEMRRMINELLRYPEDTAGSIMTVEYMALSPNMNSEQAIDLIRKTGMDKDTINFCYVVDGGNHLIGVVSLRSLIMAKVDSVISDFMEDNVISVSTHLDQEAVAQMFAKYNLGAIPVTDGEGRLVGVVTVDDAIDVLQQETNEDIAKMAAITPSERPYIKTSVFTLWKNRIPWLLLLMISATVTGMIITNFEDALSAYVILTAYIPMLMDTGGNCGSQASVTVIRALSLGQLKFSDIFKVIFKEARVSLMCGATLSAVNFLKLLFIDKVGLYVALTICFTLLVTVFVAKLVGCSLPMLAKRIGFDPAVMASPFITTIVDALSLVIYFRFASLFLGI